MASAYYHLLARAPTRDSYGAAGMERFLDDLARWDFDANEISDGDTLLVAFLRGLSKHLTPTSESGINAGQILDLLLDKGADASLRAPDGALPEAMAPSFLAERLVCARGGDYNDYLQAQLLTGFIQTYLNKPGTVTALLEHFETVARSGANYRTQDLRGGPVVLGLALQANQGAKWAHELPRATGNASNGTSLAVADRRAKDIKAMVRWVTKEMQASERLPVLSILWAVSVRNALYDPGLTEQRAKNHWIDTANHLELLMGVPSVQAREKLTQGCLQAMDGRYGNLTAQAACVVASAAGERMGGEAPTVWLQAMATLAQCEDSGWQSTPGAKRLLPAVQEAAHARVRIPHLRAQDPTPDADDWALWNAWLTADKGTELLMEVMVHLDGRGSKLLTEEAHGVWRQRLAQWVQDHPGQAQRCEELLQVSQSPRTIASAKLLAFVRGMALNATLDVAPAKSRPGRM